MNQSLICVQPYAPFKKNRIENRIHSTQKTKEECNGGIQYWSCARVIMKNEAKIDERMTCNLLLWFFEIELLINSILRRITDGSVSRMLNPIPYFFNIKPKIKTVIRIFLLVVLLIPCENNISGDVTEIYFIFSTFILLRTIVRLDQHDETELYFYETEQIVYQWDLPHLTAFYWLWS